MRSKIEAKGSAQPHAEKTKAAPLAGESASAVVDFSVSVILAQR